MTHLFALGLRIPTTTSCILAQFLQFLFQAAACYPLLLAHSLCFAAKALRNVKMKQIVKAASNNRVTSESDKNWFLQYENIRVGKPSKTEDMIVQDPRLIWIYGVCLGTDADGIHVPLASA